MPTTKRAPGKRLRVKNTRKSLAKLRALALDMEEPLTEAAGFLVALQLIGYGAPIATTAAMLFPPLPARHRSGWTR